MSEEIKNSKKTNEENKIISDKKVSGANSDNSKKPEDQETKAKKITKTETTSIRKEGKKEESSSKNVTNDISTEDKSKKNSESGESNDASKEKIVRKKLTSSVTSNNFKQKKINSSQSKSSDSRQNPSEPGNRNSEQGEYVEKLVSINRVAKVVKGGRRFSFAALVVVGDGNGMVGHGKGKAKEVPEAIKKATDEAKNSLIRVPLRQGRTLHHDIKGRFDSGKVYLRSAPSGTGVIAGGPMRAVFEALGIQDIVAKSVGTSNPHNMVRATFEALKSASSPKIIAMRRGLKINDITKRRKISQLGSENAKN
jgi:small subunit ribosomal protein S5